MHHGVLSQGYSSRCICGAVVGLRLIRPELPAQHISRQV